MFDEEGVCLACRNNEKKRNYPDEVWRDRKQELRNLCDKYRRSDYDCLIPVSGGKDSHYIVGFMKEEMGMHPLLVNVFEIFTPTEAAMKNWRNISNVFNCDFLQFRVSEDVSRRACRCTFEEFGKPLLLVEQVIYTLPLKFAIQLGIPLLVQGEDPGYEYGTLATEVPTLSRHRESIVKYADLSFWETRGFKQEELGFLRFPQDTGNYPLSIPLGYYDLWDGCRHLEFAKRHGFRDLAHEWHREGTFENYDGIDSIGWIVSFWLKYVKFGFARATDMACRQIREGRITRKEAIELVKQYDHILDQKALDDFLSFTGYSVREFWDIVEKFWNKDIFEKRNGSWVKKVCVS